MSVSLLYITIYILGQLMHLTYFATPLELRSENVSKINENFDFHCKYSHTCLYLLLWTFFKTDVMV